MFLALVEWLDYVRLFKYFFWKNGRIIINPVNQIQFSSKLKL